ncbi:FAD-dependent oxidoreductase [Treponema parvum]|uniref:FAD-dependent oxidoreductase n=1 Tax=Treponema parvum TaxID=138851 RepID=A0A975F5U5_9SPIR|nr:FAD-dependent oxidoreductase [Treponema parvum]QTQ15041.1 FAD-dependent oxidoreductase [Treponema parvum]
MGQKENMLDAAVIGTGPAGVSAALTLAARGKKFKIFGSPELSPKISKAHAINNYPGLYGKTGAQVAEEFRKHLEFLKIEITDARITNIYDMTDHFTLLSGQEQFEARTIIIATGVDFGKALPGEENFLGRGVSYCATCDGMLYKGKTTAVIAYAKSEEAEAEFLASICKKVYFIPMYKEDVSLALNSVIDIIKDVPEEIKGQLKAQKLILKKQELETDCIFILRESISPSALLQGLKLDGTHIAVDRNCRTNIPGCFAAGDITGIPYQYAKSAGEGNVAALAAVSYLNAKDKL